MKSIPKLQIKSFDKFTKPQDLVLRFFCCEAELSYLLLHPEPRDNEPIQESHCL